MERALRPGDWLMVWRGLRASSPCRVRSGQIVVAWHPRRPGLLLVKRAARPDPGGWDLASDKPGAGAAAPAGFPAVIDLALVAERVRLERRLLRLDQVPPLGEQLRRPLHDPFPAGAPAPGHRLTRHAPMLAPDCTRPGPYTHLTLPTSDTV